MSNMELVSQFTEDAIAKEDRICGRPACGSIILKGASYHYIATIVPSQPGRFICRACYLQYAQKLSTSVRPSSRPSSVRPSSAQSLPDPNVIQQSVNAAQRRSTINPPRVVPFLPQPSSSAVHMGRLPGPYIAVPLSWQQPPVSSSQNRAPGPAGYSAHHAQYSLEPYAPPPAETITLEITAVYEGNSRKKSGRGVFLDR
ncbi:uncharacterized protein F5891DRAFT_979513 [Suillus fuscotomentosus]|uniref:Uncharacterized protein n=1 Tax=Suillus fuscotomentosus TaxID=1912939 RepID=A0AAD4HM74_9AGAM|nr:uncharacterized protein F5891DRAFT_979513 [Suillus fuscotomentosus]KAG1901331.1 hypothetical protein F5891DRAFT_979513 [Suillus fuscotomentosus]